MPPSPSSVCGEEGLGGHQQHLHLLGELVVGVLLDVRLQLLLQAAQDGAHVVPRRGVLTVEIHDALLEEPVLGLGVINQVVSCVRKLSDTDKYR